MERTSSKRARRLHLSSSDSADSVIHEVLPRLPSLPPGTAMVALINDGGEQHMDTVFNDERMQVRSLLDPDTQREIDELLTKLRRNR
ncbi:hypothetical protein ACFVH0_32300 [Streptomyces sp. NPDC127117]|uniref:hypothetical protein n=1 Tax=Streptomyces sp. NPDC127117 TaxID=3345368 RepID=UPI0036300E86